MRARFVIACVCALGAVLGTIAPAQQMTYGEAEVQTVVGAKNALDQFFGLEIESLPPAMLQRAEGIAIFPNMIKGGFILGVNYGKGVLSIRKPDRTWSAPVLVTMGGGSLGFQAGVQAADIVLVFATPRSLQGILNGQKVTLGAEIYSYARSRGLFLGVSLGGSDISVDHNADSMLYGRFGVTPADVFEGRGIGIRPEVQQLIDDLNARSVQAAAPAARVSAVPQPVAMPQPVAAPPVAVPAQAAVPVPAPPVRLQPLTPATPVPVADPPLVPIR
jgi:lipid-binding SYLF domain-containing protein